MTTRASSGTREKSRLCRLLGALAALVLLSGAAAEAQVMEVDLRNQVFFEPSAVSRMVVLNPSASVVGLPDDSISVSAGYSADIVSGATEAVKAGPQFAGSPDIVSRASVTDLRHLATGGLSWRREHSRLSAAYSHGIENDYRSNSVQVAASTDFFQRNTEIELAYARGFDEVCDRAGNASLDATLRLPLDSAAGCFSEGEDRRLAAISLDNFHGAWTQAWTPVFTTQLVLSGSLQHGLLANPYRAVVIGPTGEIAQEHHPENRARGAVALRAKYYARGLRTAFGLGGRAYRDTWGILSQSYELQAERYLASWLRFEARGRFYEQTGAIFWSDDYTGGEPVTGPRGRYFTGDRELSPLRTVLGGGRLTGGFTGAPGERVAGLFLDFRAGAGADVMRTFLKEFTWAGTRPDDTLALLLSVSATGTF